jgi:hypothetical protein
LRSGSTSNLVSGEGGAAGLPDAASMALGGSSLAWSGWGRASSAVEGITRGSSSGMVPCALGLSLAACMRSERLSTSGGAMEAEAVTSAALAQTGSGDPPLTPAERPATLWANQRTEPQGGRTGVGGGGGKSRSVSARLARGVAGALGRAPRRGGRRHERPLQAA